MMTKSKLALISLLLCVLSSCATMSGDECAIADWAALGYEDGQSGRTLAYKNERAKDCAKHGIGIDHRAYDQARDRGLARYCVAETAYDLGKRGQRYTGVCADHNESVFLLAYEQGNKHGEFIRAVNRINGSIKSGEKELASLEEAFAKLQHGEVEPPISEEQAFDQAIPNMQRQLYLTEVFLPYWYEQKDAANSQLQEFSGRMAAGDTSAMSMQVYHYEPAPEQEENFDQMHAVIETAARFYSGVRSPTERYVKQACKLYEYGAKELEKVPDWNLFEGTNLVHDHFLHALDLLKQSSDYVGLFRDSFREDAIAIKVSRACPEVFKTYRRLLRKRLY